jgi:hypothetical protein
MDHECKSCGNRTRYLNQPDGAFNCSLYGHCTTPCQFSRTQDKRGRAQFFCKHIRVQGTRFCSLHGEQVTRQQKHEQQRDEKWTRRVADQARMEEHEKLKEAKKQNDLAQKKREEDACTAKEKKQEFDALVIKWSDHKKLEATLRKECKHAQQNLAFFNGNDGILRNVFMLRKHTDFADGGKYAIISSAFYEELMQAKTACCFPFKLPEINPLCTCTYCVTASVVA